MKAYLKILAISLFLISSFDTFAQDANKQQEALDAYQKGEYQYAAGLYEEILSQGQHAYELYYNLGNAYFKQNLFAKSILYYEKALRLKPNDENTLFNLNVARTKTIDKIEPLPELFFKKWWKGLIGIQNTGSWAYTCIILWVFLLASIAVFLAAKTIGIKKIAFSLAIALLALNILSFTLAYKSYQNLTNKNEAIIMSQRLTAKSAPNAGSTDLFVIHEGAKVHITDRMTEWVEIKLDNGSVGWIKTGTFELI
ncbi:MAG: tetratricopeptide repeat protein [Bacteroidales bacterium]|nr:tetratricopeptide repeat protein [Bacteroidales bacterium]